MSNLLKGVTPIQLVTFVAISAAGWILYKLFDQIAEAGDKFGQGAADAIPQGVYDWVAGPTQQTSAAAVLPDGRSVTFAQVVASGGALRNAGGERYVFTYQGIEYRVVPPRRADGRYNAVRN